VVDDGHLFIVTRPQEVAAVVRDFLAEDSRSKPAERTRGG
jgi:hypothetical protein